MGPFPHDAPAARISTDNPMGTDGFEFVEYAHPRPEELHALLRLMGYVPVARHRTRQITVYRQGDINYLVIPGCAPWRRPGINIPAVVRDSGLTRFARAPE